MHRQKERAFYCTVIKERERERGRSDPPPAKSENDQESEYKEGEQEKIRLFFNAIERQSLKYRIFYMISPLVYFGILVQPTWIELFY